MPDRSSIQRIHPFERTISSSSSSTSSFCCCCLRSCLRSSPTFVDGTDDAKAYKLVDVRFSSKEKMGILVVKVVVHANTINSTTTLTTGDVFFFFLLIFFSIICIFSPSSPKVVVVVVVVVVVKKMSFVRSHSFVRFSFPLYCDWQKNNVRTHTKTLFFSFFFKNSSKILLLLLLFRPHKHKQKNKNKNKNKNKQRTKGYSPDIPSGEFLSAYLFFASGFDRRAFRRAFRSSFLNFNFLNFSRNFW